MKETENKELTDFLKVAFGQKEVGLIIAKDRDQLSDFSGAMEGEGFKKLDSVFGYQNAEHGWYVVIEDSENFKEVYDFICQYPITVISLFDSKNSENVVIKPDFKNPTIFSITEEKLKDFQLAGFDLLGRVGLTYRSE